MIDRISRLWLDALGFAIPSGIEYRLEDVICAVLSALQAPCTYTIRMCAGRFLCRHSNCA